MPRDDSESEAERLARSVKSAGDALGQAGPAAAAGYTLIGSILLLGAAGYGLDRWWGTTPWCLIGGLLLGMALGFYELIKTTWPRR